MTSRPRDLRTLQPVPEPGRAGGRQLRRHVVPGRSRPCSPGGADHYILGVDFGPFDALRPLGRGVLQAVPEPGRVQRGVHALAHHPDATVGELFNSGTGKAYGGGRLPPQSLEGLGGMARLLLRRRQPQDPRLQLRPRVPPDLRPAAPVRRDAGPPLGQALADELHVPLRLRPADDPRRSGATPCGTSTGASTTSSSTGEKNASRLPAYHRLDVGVF